ncbi:MAG TPA: 50S ribosomal protein L21 [Spirochaetales bacterium]|nr:50S ribosomal protein L21 [Spirochaetales bacterium]HOV37195.1 50S ribosomal protein L21 [Spirochaetales bacterium]
MYALVEIKGKQYRAEEGSVLKVDKIAQEKGSPVELNSVMLVEKEGNVSVGTPYISGVTLKTVVEDHGKAKKIIGFKYKKRKNYRRRWGHREEYTLLKVEEIAGV